jgi:TonB family protein
MFATLPVSGAPRQPITRAAVIAGLLHLIVIVAAVRVTTGKTIVSLPAPRDTIRLVTYRLDEPALRERRIDPAPDIAAPQVPPFPVGAVPRIDLSFTPPRVTPGQFIRPEVAGPPKENTPGRFAPDSVFSVSDVDVAPEIRYLRPDYPVELQHAGISGAVVVEYVVLPSGRADSASVRVIATTEPAFTNSVLVAVRGAGFTPARRRGHTVPVLVRQTIRFLKR